ncbi:hypothetical protein ECC02_012640 [Trypanosoma cruzi]|uniref:Uncharacterized protein n=1 Tax=Trypanosoma cruzi TaxID=5693 RepID=A0A7J6XJY5_TRYCR|nr:hypothetical protein ECC02_012640 [Trypanosoma cruzi]
MKQRNASKGAECRHPVRRRHGAILAMHEAQATKQLSSAIVIASCGFALLFLGASTFSAAPTAAAVDHAAAAITPTERQGRVCGSVPRTQRLPSPEEAIVAPSVTRQHTPSKAHTRQYKYILAEHFANTYVCGRLLEKLKRELQGGTSAQQEAQLDGSDTCGTAPTSTITHGGSKHPSTEKKNTAAGCGCVCGAADVCQPSPQKNKTRGKEMCAPPHRPSSHAHTSRLPQRAVRRCPSSCVQQARRTGPSS